MNTQYKQVDTKKKESADEVEEEFNMMQIQESIKNTEIIIGDVQHH